MSPSEVATRASSELARRDPALPALPLLLDDDLLADWLARGLGGGTVSVRRRYLRYKRGTSCVAAVDLRTHDGGPPQTVKVAHWSRAAAAKLAKSRRKAAPGSLLVVDETAGVLVATPAADRHLPALRLLSDPEHRADLLGAVGALGTGGTTCTTLAYKPQRRWVGRLAGDDGRSVLLRAYRAADLPAAALAWAHGSELVADRVPTARLLDTRPRAGLALVEWVDGRPLRLPDDTDRLAELGTAVARMHRAPARLPAVSAGAHRRALRATAGSVADLLPPLAGRVDRLTDRVLAALGSLPEALPVALHGDLSADQVVVASAGGLRLVDLDRARSGPAVDDLAGFAAAARVEGHDPGPLLDQLLAGYAAHATPPSAAAWAAYLAAQLLARATDGFRTARPDWDERLRDVLDAVEELV